MSSDCRYDTEEEVGVENDKELWRNVESLRVQRQCYGSSMTRGINEESVNTSSSSGVPLRNAVYGGLARAPSTPSMLKFQIERRAGAEESLQSKDSTVGIQTKEVLLEFGCLQ